MNKHTRRWWLIVFVIVVAAAAAAAAAYLLVFRDKAASVHYLTSTAATGTIADTVQADFTLADSRDAMTISLSGTGSSSSSANGNNGASTTSASSAHSAITTMRAIVASPAAVVDGFATVRAAAMTSSTTLALSSFTPVSGAVGTSVTLTGSGLSGTSAVTFNGQAAFFKVESDTEIATIVPTGATSGPIAVTTGDGTATSTEVFTVTPSPKPTPSHTATATPRPTASRSASSGSGSSSRSGGSSTGGSASLTASSSSSSASSSSGTTGVVTRIVLPAGATPATLQPLMTISSKPIFAFVSSTPLYETLSTSLASGDDRANVAALQRALKARGYFSGTVDGDFGSTTRTALEAWQSAHGLSQTGEITTSDFVWVPKGGAIESWNVVLGSTVSSTTALATVDFPRLLIAQANVTQADVSSLKVGQKAALTIDGQTSSAFTATITSIATQPSSSSSGSSSSTAEYTVDLVPGSLPTLAKSGMTGSLTVTIAKRSNVLLVPTSAVSGTSSASFVRVMMNGIPSYREVTTGMATSSLTQITSGLTAGELVVTGTYTNAASSSTSTGTGGGLGGFTGGGAFRRSTSGSFNGGSGTFIAPGGGGG